MHGVMISRREQEDGLLNLSYQRGHPDTYNLEHTTAFDYKLLIYHWDPTALGPVVAFKLIPNDLRTEAPGSMTNEYTVGNLRLIMRTSNQVLLSLIWSDHQLWVIMI